MRVRGCGSQRRMLAVLLTGVVSMGIISTTAHAATAEAQVPVDPPPAARCTSRPAPRVMAPTAAARRPVRRLRHADPGFYRVQFRHARA